MDENIAGIRRLYAFQLSPKEPFIPRRELDDRDKNHPYSIKFAKAEQGKIEFDTKGYGGSERGQTDNQFKISGRTDGRGQNISEPFSELLPSAL